MADSERGETIAVVIPAFREKARIGAVLAAIGPECQAVYVVDDACPEGTGDAVEAACDDGRVRVLRHATNRGVGAATLTGLRAALGDGHTVIVKLDGDGQMDPAGIPTLVAPILAGEADYVKGNRFFDLESLRPMPAVRLLGNAALSFVNKLSTGYWDLFDPTNGFTAIDARVAGQLPLEKINEGYFFESDMLFRLGTLRAVVKDVPMAARYADEESQLRVRRALPEFAWRHAVNTAKRVFYNYFLRNFSLASVQIVLGPLLLAAGSLVGVVGWAESVRSGQVASSGTVMLAALPILIGLQLVLAFLGHDMQNVPRDPLRNRLSAWARGAASTRPPAGT